MKTNHKVVASIVLLTLVIISGGIWLTSRSATKEKEKLSRPLLGEAVLDQGRNHVPDSTKVEYNSNPPTSGPHYINPKPAGIYEKLVPDGNLVHSLEHGAVIIWYKSDLPQEEVDRLKNIYHGAAVGKKIMVPRDNLDVPVTLTSWTRLLKLQTIDEAQIKAFLETNEGRGPENAPL